MGEPRLRGDEATIDRRRLALLGASSFLRLALGGASLGPRSAALVSWTRCSGPRGWMARRGMARRAGQLAGPELGSLGLGLGAGVLGGPVSCGGGAPGLLGVRRRRRELALWAADRAGHALYGLGADGAVLLRVPVDAPVEVRERPGGGCYVLSAVARRRRGPTRWLAWTGEDLRPVRAPISSLSPGPGEEPVGEPEAKPGGKPGAKLGVRPGALPGAWPGARASGDAAKGAGLRGAGGSLLALRWSGGQVLWALREGEDGSAALEVWRPSGGGAWRRSVRRRLPFAAVALASDGEGAWVAGHRVPSVVRVSAAGRITLRVELEGVDGVEDLLPIPAREGGGVWLAACGALVRLDAAGRRRPGQGGFEHLVSLASAQSPSS